MASCLPQATGTRPEVEIILGCARTVMDAARAGRLTTLLQSDLDWDYLLKTAWRHGLTPLLYHHFNATCPEVVPTATLNDLRGCFYTTTLHNFLLTRELLKILRLFEQHGIPAIPFKGPTLAALAYHNLSFRQFSDLDILVHKHHMLRAKDLLISQDYHPTIHLDSEQEAEYLQSNYFIFERYDGDRKMKVDLQWQIRGPSFSFAIDTNDFWKRRSPISLAGAKVHTFSPEILLLLLCVHGAKHQWETLKWICDVAELIRVHEGMHWDQTMGLARSMNSERTLTLGLYLAHDLLGVTLPQELLYRAQGDSGIHKLAAQIGKRIFTEIDEETNTMERFVFYLRIKDSDWDRMWCLLPYLRLVITPTAADQALLPLPSCLVFLYYILRPLRLIGKYGLRPWTWKDLLSQRIDLG